MIESGDLSRPCRIQVEEARPRDWRYLWLKRRVVYRTVWAGFIDSCEQTMTSGSRVVVVDAMSRLMEARWSF